MSFARAFLNDERGAVTIEFVALGSSVLLVGIASVYAVYRYGVEPVVGGVNTVLVDYSNDLEAPEPPTLGD